MDPLRFMMIGFATLSLSTAGLTLNAGTEVLAASCKPGLSAERLNKRKKLAKSFAVSSWQRKAKQQYGWKYALWSNASQKKVACGKSGGQWRCIARGKPCFGGNNTMAN